MKIIGESKLHEFARRHANSRAAIVNWVNVVKLANWQNLVDVKATFNSADYVKDRVVFNIGGNNYRVIAVVDHTEGTLYVREIMTHAEYDRWKA